jgi:6-phosphofructokinase
MSDRDSDVKGITIGIIVGGRPTPGINGVIGAATIEVTNSVLRVLGTHDGFRHLADEYFNGMAR